MSTSITTTITEPVHKYKDDMLTSFNYSPKISMGLDFVDRIINQSNIFCYNLASENSALFDNV